MGLFASRPEEPDEWAGIPSEPLRASSTADLLSDGAPIDALDLVTGQSLASLTIDLSAVAVSEPGTGPDAEPGTGADANPDASADEARPGRSTHQPIQP